MNASLIIIPSIHPLSNAYPKSGREGSSFGSEPQTPLSPATSNYYYYLQFKKGGVHQRQLGLSWLWRMGGKRQGRRENRYLMGTCWCLKSVTSQPSRSVGFSSLLQIKDQLQSNCAERNHRNRSQPSQGIYTLN